MTPVAVGSLSVDKRKMEAEKWILQFFCGAPKRYVARHDRGVVSTPPTLQTLDGIRDMCGLEPYVADLWLKVLESVLNQIVEYAREINAIPSAQARCGFAIIVDPGRQISIHRYKTGPAAKEVQVVSEQTLSYLESTLG